MEVYENAVKDMFKDMFKDNFNEQGGWVYQNKRGHLRAIRKVREARDGQNFIFLNKPPSVKGYRVVGTFHTHNVDLGPSGDPPHLVNGVLMASGDYLANYNQGVPGLVITRVAGGGIGYYPYGPSRGFFGVGVPSGCGGTQ